MIFFGEIISIKNRLNWAEKSLHLRDFNRKKAMSQHNSFKKIGGGIIKKRNVIKRFERVELLRKRGQWKDGDRVTGLRKTKAEE